MAIGLVSTPKCDRAVVTSSTAPLVVDASGNTLRALDGLSDFTALDITNDGSRAALKSPFLVTKGTNRARFVVVDVERGDILFETTDHLVYRARFDALGETVLLEASNRPLFSLDARSGRNLHTFETKNAMLGYGALLQVANQLWVANGKQNAVYELDLAAGTTKTHKKPLAQQVVTMVAVGDDFICTTTGGLVRTTTSWRVRWATDFADLRARGITFGAAMILTPSGDGKLIAMEALDPTCEWGCIVAIDVESGAVVRTIRGRQGLGRIAASWSGDSVMTFAQRVVDLRTGEITPRT